MHDLPSLARLLADARIASLVAAPSPAFLIDSGGELRFANRAALLLLRVGTLSEAIGKGASVLGVLGERARELVTGLAPGGSPRIEHLRPPDHSQPLLFAASHFSLGADGDAVLIVAVDNRGGRPIELGFALPPLIDAANEAFAFVTPDGTTIHANATARNLIGDLHSLAELNGEVAAALALASREGSAATDLDHARVVLRRIETGAIAMLLATLDPLIEPTQPTLAAVAPSAPETVPGENSSSTPPPQLGTAEAPSRAPTRFVWQMDADGRFTQISSELAAAVGVQHAAVIGLNWLDLASRIGVGGVEAIQQALSKRDTWSGVSVIWPIADTELSRPVDLAALPIFDRARNFLGFRGFGVFRDPVARPATGSAPAGAKSIAASEPTRPAEQPGRAPLVLVEHPENIVRLRAGSADQRPGLTPGERTAFREIARVLGASFDEETRVGSESPSHAHHSAEISPRASADGERAVLDRLPLGIVVHRSDRVLYANRVLLEWTGLTSLGALAERGGLASLFAGAPPSNQDEGGPASRTLAILGRDGEPIPVEARLLTAPWDGETALVYVLRRAGAGLDDRIKATELALRAAEGTNRELRAILDTATDGILLLDREGRVLALNRSAEALFGFDSSEIEGQSFTLLFAPESRRPALDYLEGLSLSGVASVLNDGREVTGRVREGGLLALFMTLGRVDDEGSKFCAVFRDISQWKRAEQELLAAKRQAEKTSSAKSDFLAKVSHEIRTPLNAIIGFAEVMAEERFGSIGNQRYREYLKDIRASGEHLISLVNDLLDLSKIEAGKLELAFASVDLNEIAQQCMAIMQPQANRERIIIRTALATRLPPVVADPRSIRQIVLNLLSNSIRFTPPGGQVIVSTALTDAGEVALRVRDTGVGMSEVEIATALEPFRQLVTSGRSGSGGTGLGLPLTKALVEANRASFAIKSSINAGTLIEVIFPTTRVLAE